MAELASPERGDEAGQLLFVTRDERTMLKTVPGLRHACEQQEAGAQLSGVSDQAVALGDGHGHFPRDVAESCQTPKRRGLSASSPSSTSVATSLRARTAPFGVPTQYGWCRRHRLAGQS